MRKSKPRTLKKKADVLFSQIIRGQNVCEALGYAGKRCSATLDCAHIISRRFSNTRTDTRNAYSLCWVHHRFFHDHPREFSRFITGTWAQSYYDSIYQKSLSPAKIDWQERLDFLNQIKDGQITLNQARKVEDET